eukprot:4471090-Amphidinium_carterae.1
MPFTTTADDVSIKQSITPNERANKLVAFSLRAKYAIKHARGVKERGIQEAFCNVIEDESERGLLGRIIAQFFKIFSFLLNI